jgi:hypothetical protein
MRGLVYEGYQEKTEKPDQIRKFSQVAGCRLEWLMDQGGRSRSLMQDRGNRLLPMVGCFLIAGLKSPGCLSFVSLMFSMEVSEVHSICLGSQWPEEVDERLEATTVEVW